MSNLLLAAEQHHLLLGNKIIGMLLEMVHFFVLWEEEIRSVRGMF